MQKILSGFKVKVTAEGQREFSVCSWLSVFWWPKLKNALLPTVFIRFSWNLECKLTVGQGIKYVSFFRKFVFFRPPDFWQSLILLIFFDSTHFQTPPHTHPKHFLVRILGFAPQMTQNIKSQSTMARQRLKCGYNYKKTCRWDKFVPLPLSGLIVCIITRLIP